MHLIWGFWYKVLNFHIFSYVSKTRVRFLIIVTAERLHINVRHKLLIVHTRMNTFPIILTALQLNLFCYAPAATQHPHTSLLLLSHQYRIYKYQYVKTPTLLPLNKLTVHHPEERPSAQNKGIKISVWWRREDGGKGENWKTTWRGSSNRSPKESSEPRWQGANRVFTASFR